MTRSPTYRLLAVLTALAFGLGWGAPVVHAACGSLGTTAPDRCGTSDSAEHCESDLGPISAACLSHHASQEALTGTSPSPDVQVGGGVGTEAELGHPWMGKVISSRPSHRRAVLRARRRHAHIGVWLE